MKKAEQEQYRRHLSLNGFGAENQLKLKNASVLVVGAGGLGCSALQYLASAGIGKIGIIDDDRVEISNLQRQVLFNHADQGCSKSEVAARKLAKMNPFIEIQAFDYRLNKENVLSLLKDFHLVIDGTDNFSSRYLINDACVMLDKPLIHGSIHQFEGMISVFNFNSGPTYRCLFPEQPDPSSIPSCAEAGVLGVLPGVIGCWQALEAIKVITGLGEPLCGKILLYNALTQKSRTVSIKTIPENRKIKELPDPIVNCQNTNPKCGITDISEHDLNRMMLEDKDLQILDVREDWERQEVLICPSTHLPLGYIVEENKEMILKSVNPAENLVVYCKAGIRSKMACQTLQKVGFSKLFNLSNGMDGWMDEFPELTNQ